MREATINGAAGEINITTPKLPNLQIRYIQKFLNKTITQNGGYVVTEWEIFNRGFNPVNEDFNVSIFLSEDDSYDVWDAKLVEKRVTDDIAGYSSIIVAIIVKMPYVTWRNNGWSLFSAYEKYDPVKGDEMYTRELPPNGPPGYMFCVYPCIESTSKLIALVDSRGTNEVLESIETDNYSFMGPGGNGELKAETNPTGFKDIELLDFRVANYIFSPGGNTANVYDISIRYSASIQYADYCSFAFYWSKDDKAHFGDYFIQRYWFQIQPGIDILLYPFGINIVWKPDPLPPAGTYRMVMVMDDIFKFAESDESNNAKVSRGTVTVN